MANIFDNSLKYKSNNLEIDFQKNLDKAMHSKLHVKMQMLRNHITKNTDEKYTPVEITYNEFEWMFKKIMETYL